MEKNIIIFIIVFFSCIGLRAQNKIVLDPNQYIIKDIKYDYDLISGKVNKVTYQQDADDQLLHHYEYDGDNRITAVYTSTDGVDWTREATYHYYAHGPIAKTELGAMKVEIQDYAYTLQGWIKGVKGENFSYALGYYGNDYKGINASTYGGDQVGLKATPIANNTSGKSTGLYTANIATWISLNPKINGSNMWTQQFTYDQLNRIKTGITNSGGTQINSYKNTYSYDANGNITELQRFTGTKDDASNVITPRLMDDLKYKYEDKKSGYLINTNRLRWVDDSPDLSNATTQDIDDQYFDNYNYDDVGNLNIDMQEDIVKIEWTVSGKVKAVLRTSNPITLLPTGNKPNLFFDYDANGRRVSKISINNDGNTSKTYYIRDASSNVMSTYETTSSSILLKEQHIYGNFRLGVLERGVRFYEITDHLDNVRTIVNDRKNIENSMDYYPFGMLANSYSSSTYRYGFNGMEKDNEIKGSGNWYDTEHRVLDPRLGKWLSLDPIVHHGSSPYVAFNNNPIYFKDPTGAEGEPEDIKVSKGTPKSSGAVNSGIAEKSPLAKATGLGDKKMVPGNTIKSVDEHGKPKQDVTRYGNAREVTYELTGMDFSGFTVKPGYTRDVAGSEGTKQTQVAVFTDGNTEIIVKRTAVSVTGEKIVRGPKDVLIMQQDRSAANIDDSPTPEFEVSTNNTTGQVSLTVYDFVNLKEPDLNSLVGDNGEVVIGYVYKATFVETIEVRDVKTGKLISTTEGTQWSTTVAVGGQAGAWNFAKSVKSETIEIK